MYTNARRANRYYGSEAVEYESRRRSEPVWDREQQAVKEFVEGFASDRASLLDVPVGTGRFFEIYRDAGVDVTAMDVSEDMVSVAMRLAADLRLPVRACMGSILEIPASEGSFDAAVCFRLLNWLSLSEVRTTLEELSRVTSQAFAVSIRYRLPLKEALLPMSVARSMSVAWRRTRFHLSRVRQATRGSPVSNSPPRDRLLALVADSGLTIRSSTVLAMQGDVFEYVMWVVESAQPPLAE